MVDQNPSDKSRCHKSRHQKVRNQFANYATKLCYWKSKYRDLKFVVNTGLSEYFEWSQSQFDSKSSELWKWRYCDIICRNGLSVILFKSRDASKFIHKERKYDDGSSLEDDWSSKYIVSLFRNLEVKIDSRKFEIQSLHRDLLSKSKFDSKYLCENYQLSVRWIKTILSDIHLKRCTIPSCSWRESIQSRK